MIKILTITTSYANNYGALIQCYALSKFLNNFPDLECNVIQYYRPDADNSWKVLHRPRTFRDIIKNIYLIFNIKQVKCRRQKNEKMKYFIKKYIPFTKEKWYTPESIRVAPPIADIYICGSDQIWNMKYKFEGKTIYFLDFVNKGKKISYAASIAEPWDDDDVKLITPLIQSFHAVSIRERGNLPQVQKLFPNATVTIDPVFLLNKSQWLEFANKSLCPKEQYILCYFLSVSELAVKTLKKIRELTGFKVVHLNLNALDKFHSDKNIIVADPCDFVGLISNAAFICTNSFHCSAFSIIFQKDFVFIPKKIANERIKNLQDTFQIGDICINEEKLANLRLKDLKINYSKGSCQGEDFINYSKQFLANAIYGNNH